MQHTAPDPQTITDPQALADAVGAAMWARDHAAHALGMRLDAIAPGQAQLSMTVRHDMLNGHAICHGGMIFTLADTAFAYACNSDNHNTVASACHIDFLAPAHEGDQLQATAQVRIQGGRMGVYDITVRNLTSQKDIVLFRGKSHRIQGLVTDTLNTDKPGAPA
ncbi:hydroxyphenylacetyl-CoA thioesterase PaaI [Castellaniella caeni]|uniref:hydroxyphenylacetyl-CoA thioesterase PaaI n=1 Tax=Castellaniella caeni TaxID=266123 RepID=UPI000832987E|nr:hydroxyphenylacetyl-CoA thioesterase PaaI [Castellaniella caeni]